jgi:hypothetical protein
MSNVKTTGLFSSQFWRLKVSGESLMAEGITMVGVHAEETTW